MLQFSHPCFLCSQPTTSTQTSKFTLMDTNTLQKTSTYAANSWTVSTSAAVNVTQSMCTQWMTIVVRWICQIVGLGGSTANCALWRAHMPKFWLGISKTPLLMTATTGSHLQRLAPPTFPLRCMQRQRNWLLSTWLTLLKRFGGWKRIGLIRNAMQSGTEWKSTK